MYLEGRYQAVSAVGALLKENGASCESFIADFVSSAQVFTQQLQTRKEEISKQVAKLLGPTESATASEWSVFTEKLSNIFKASFLGDVYGDDAIVLDHLEVILDAVEDYVHNKKNA